MKNIVVLVLLSAVSTFALGHDGHDHSAPEAGLVHLLWLLPMIIAAGIGYSLFKSKSDKEEG